MVIHDKLFANLRELGINIDMETLSKRKHMQKLVYILQEFGIEFGFDDYNWYLYGPYSPQLTKTVFDVTERRKQVNANHKLLRDELSIIKAVSNFLGEDIDYPNRLELIASLIYLRKLIRAENRNPDDYRSYIIDQLKSKKSQFSYREIEKAWIKLETYSKIK